MSEVYVVMVGNVVHSVLTNPSDVEKIQQTNPKARVVKSSLIDKLTSSTTGVVEGEEDEFGLPPKRNNIPPPDDNFDDVDLDDIRDPEQHVDSDLHAPEELDVVITDVPFMLRVLEWAREESTQDEQLHELVEEMVKLSNSHDCVLTMAEYGEIMAIMGIADTDEQHQDPEEQPNGDEPPADGSDFDEFDEFDDVDSAPVNIREGAEQKVKVMTLSDYAVSKKARVVPTIADIFKKTRKPPTQEELATILVQDQKTTAFVLKGTTTNPEK